VKRALVRAKLPDGARIMNKICKYLSILLTAAMLVSVAACSSTSSKESTGEYIDDSWITTKVKADILNEPMLKVFDIKVDTLKGNVMLSGNVASQAASDRAVQVARSVKGVTAVTNRLQIK
jgi:hyperosmotically inducible protein